MNSWNKKRPNLSQLVIRWIKQALGKIGALGRIRTPDPLIRSQEGESENPRHDSSLSEDRWGDTVAESRNCQRQPAGIPPHIHPANDAQEVENAAAGWTPEMVRQWRERQINQLMQEESSNG